MSVVKAKEGLSLVDCSAYCIEELLSRCSSAVAGREVVGSAGRLEIVCKRSNGRARQILYYCRLYTTGASRSISSCKPKKPMGAFFHQIYCFENFYQSSDQ